MCRSDRRADISDAVMYVALILLAAYLFGCAVVNGSAYRVQPCPARSDTTATADSLRRHIGCFDTRDSTRKER